MTTWVAVLLSILPGLGQADAEKLVQLTARYADLYDVPVALILAIQYRETRWGTQLQHQNAQDHGVMGVRVSRLTRPEYLGRETDVRDLETNIRLGAEALAGWRRFHRKRCIDGEHAWFAHYQWGRIVRDGRSADRVQAIYQRLLNAHRKLVRKKH